MKANALLIAKETSDSNAAIAEATARAGLVLLKATDAKRAFEVLRGAEEIDLAIIDIDPGIHSMALLETITSHETAVPVIVVIGFEHSDEMPIARRHGAATCIAKPFTAAELTARIEDVWPVDQAPNSHVCENEANYHNRVKQAAHKCCGECRGCASGALRAATELCFS
jgi:DNA-binding NtrC family response regulator